MDKSEAIVADEAPAATVARGMSRWRAAGTHLLISAGIAAGVLALMLALWYPPPLFEAMGGIGLALILVGVDVVMGPALTLVVFRSGKRGLKFDLAAIGLVQLVALLYGCYIVALARPAFIVFVRDQFQVVTPAELVPEALAEARYPEFRSAPWTGPLFVFGEWPKDHAEQQRMLMAGLAGADLQHFPRYYAPYAQGRGEILQKALPLSRVSRAEPEMARAIDSWLARSGADAEKLRYVRLRGRNAWVVVLIDSATAAPVKMLIGQKI